MNMKKSISCLLYTSGDQLQQGQIQRTFANSELAWETAEQVNFGIDFGTLNMRLTGTID